MDTYINFFDSYVKVGKNSADGADLICKNIIEGIDNAKEGVAICFKPLTDNDFEKLTKCFENPVKFGEESYIVEIDDIITIYYTAEITKQYALYAIKRNYSRDGIKKGVIYSTPKVPFRCYRSYLPGKKNIEWFKKFVDMQIAFGNNALMLELGGAMEYKSHPEINEGWVEYCEMLNTPEKLFKAKRISPFPKNSIHTDNGDGEWLTYEEITEILDYCKERHMEVIPEVPSLSHSDYILFKHPEMAETTGDLIPNFACPLNEDYQALIRDILDEIVDLFKPKRVNICHDETYVIGICPRCAGKDTRELFNEDILRMYNYLKEKGVGTMVWCDCVMPTSRAKDCYHERTPWDGHTTIDICGKNYKVRGFRWRSAEEWAEIKVQNPDAEAWFARVKHRVEMLPKDIEVLNWYWRATNEDVEGMCIENGFTNYFGNFLATGMKDFEARIKRGVTGVSVSNWGGTSFEGMQRASALFSVAFNAYVSWCNYYDGDKREDAILYVADLVYRYINYDILMGKYLEITHSTDAVIKHEFFIDGVKVVREEYRMGDYEVVYADGTVDTIPVYWGYNIGNNSISWGYEEEGYTLYVADGGYCRDYVFETIGTSKPTQDGKATWHTMAVPVEKDVKSLTFKSLNGYKVDVKEWAVK